MFISEILYIYLLYLIHIGSCSDEKTSESKRLLASDPEFVLRELNSLKTEIADLKNSNAVLQNAVSQMQSSGIHGSTYTRWGKKTCAGNMTDLVYTGFVGGNWYDHTGSASNFLCLPTDPIWGNHSDVVDTYRGKIYGAEYENLQFSSALHDEDAPCAVCRSRVMSTVLMIPGRNQCYPGWTMEYNGYLVSDWYGHKSPSEYICLDSNPDVIIGGHDDKNGATFFSVEGICGSLPCPPYVNGRELTCVVCSK